MPYNFYNKFKVHVVWLVFHKFGVIILIWEISPGLLFGRQNLTQMVKAQVLYAGFEFEYPRMKLKDFVFN